jgi:hypothetical protein
METRHAFHVLIANYEQEEIPESMWFDKLDQ